MSIENCYSCKIFEKFNTKSQGYATFFFGAVSEDLIRITQYLFILWLVFNIYELMIGKRIEAREFIIQFSIFSFVTCLLKNASLCHDVYYALFDLGLDMGGRVLTQISSDVQGKGNGIEAVLFFCEESFSNIFTFIGKQLTDIGFMGKVKAFLFVIPIAIVYFFLLLKMFGSLFSIYVQLFAVTLCCPILLTLFIIPTMRSPLFASIKIALLACLQLILVCATIGIINIYVKELPISEDNLTLDINSTDYLTLLFTGFLLIGAYNTILSTPAQIINMVSQSNNGTSEGVFSTAVQKLKAGSNFAVTRGTSLASSGAKSLYTKFRK